MSINFIINLQLYKDSIIGAYTLFRDSIQMTFVYYFQEYHNVNNLFLYQPYIPYACGMDSA